MIVEGLPWCMFAGPRTWERERAIAVLSGIDPNDYIAIEAALVEAFGTWILGRESVGMRVTPEEELERWFELLARIERVFDEVSALPATGVADEVARVVMAAIPIVVDLTQLEEQWFSELVPLVQWYCERAGISAPGLGGLIEESVAGVFNSWTLPADGGAQSAAMIGAAVAGVAAPLDAIAAWTAGRRWPTTAEPEPPPGTRSVTVDAHARYIDTVDRARDPARADALVVALDACRASVGAPLTFAMLASWQQIVLDSETVPALRTTDAFAKRGRERYAAVPDLAARVDAALRDAEDASTSLVVRAVRLYFDICFLHPFADGNARAARLALDHFLGRHGYGLHAIAPLARVAWPADTYVLVYAARVLKALVGPLV